MSDTDETHTKGIRIIPGQWRPHYPFEQIVWISPPWPSQDYVWLDFPEAIFSDQGLLYLSHINPKYPVLFADLPKVEWDRLATGSRFSRNLPNGIQFGGSVMTNNVSTIELELHIKNGSPEPLTGIKLQTCMYFRAIKEFSDFTNNNKFVHLPSSGWLPLSEALTAQQEDGYYRLGWRGGRALADLPTIVAVSNQAQRLVAMTWHENTRSLIGNENHPCMHADPGFNDVASGQSASICGEIIFLEGTLDDFEDYMRNR